MGTQAPETEQIVMDLFPPEVLQPPITEVPLAELPPSSILLGEDPSSAFVDDIKKRGVRSPIMLAEDGRGGYLVVAGTRRVKAARQAKHATIPARIWPQGHLNSYSEGIAENAHRADNVPREVLLIDGLRKQGHRDEDIMKRLHLPKPRYLRRIALLDRLEPPLLAAFLSGQMSANTAEAAVKLKTDRQAELLALLEARQAGLNEKTKEGKDPPLARLTTADLKEAAQAGQQETKAALGALLDETGAPTLAGAAAQPTLPGTNGHAPAGFVLPEDVPSHLKSEGDVTTLHLRRSAPWSHAVYLLLSIAMNYAEVAMEDGEEDARVAYEVMLDARGELPTPQRPGAEDEEEEG